MSDHKSRRKTHGRGEETRRPAAPPMDGSLLPEELSGRASATSEDLTELFENDTADHFADGFRGGSNSDRSSDLVKDVDTDPDSDDVTAD